jgi:hypothetical protein
MIVAILFAAFLAPSIYSGAMLALTGGYYLHRGFTRTDPLPDGTLTLLAVLTIFSALSMLGPTLAYGQAGQNIDAFKFFFATAAFAMGVAMANDRGGLLPAVAVLTVALTLYYAGVYLTEFELNQDSLVYPPSNNHSAAMLAMFLPLIVLRGRGSARIALLGVMALFALFSASRALLALTVIATAATPRKIRDNIPLLATASLLAGLILFWDGFSMDNFSDRLRLQIIEVSYAYVTTRGANAFNFGEAAFTNYLNTYPIYRRLEIEHAHNIILEIWAAYGIVPLIAFTVFFVGLATHAVRQRNQLLLAELAILVLFGAIEALVSDIRAFGTIMFALGYGFVRRPLPGASSSKGQEADTGEGEPGSRASVPITPRIQ